MDRRTAASEDLRDPNYEHLLRCSRRNAFRLEPFVETNGRAGACPEEWKRMGTERSQIETRRLLKRDVIKKARSCGFIRLISQLGRRFAYVKHSRPVN